MRIRYFRRFRMELLLEGKLPEPVLPAGYCWVRWNSSLTPRHASAKHNSFRAEIDATVFPSLGEYAGCLRLMEEISRQAMFLPAATWLICHAPHVEGEFQDVATIQGIIRSNTIGAIQNVGVVPDHRGQGLGRALLLKALHGFQNSGMHKASLEVTADNTPAVELYRSLGFQLTRTLYRAVETPELVL